MSSFNIYFVEVPMTKISDSFIMKIKSSQQPIYLLAIQAGLHPSRLSRILGGEKIHRPHDIRFKFLANLVKFQGKLFKKD